MHESESEKSDKKVKVMLRETGKRKWKQFRQGSESDCQSNIKTHLVVELRHVQLDLRKSNHKEEIYFKCF